MGSRAVNMAIAKYLPPPKAARIAIISAKIAHFRLIKRPPPFLQHPCMYVVHEKGRKMANEMKQFATIFFTVLFAEMGDKTQLATLLFATEQNVGRIAVFVAAAAALVTSSALAVVAGSWVTKAIPTSTLRVAAGVGFIAIGIWTLITKS